MFHVDQPLPARYLFGATNLKIPITRLGPPMTGSNDSSLRLQNPQISPKNSETSLPAPLKLDKNDFIGFLPYQPQCPEWTNRKDLTPSMKIYRRMVSYAQPCALCLKAVLPRGLLVVLPCAHILHPECADEMRVNDRACSGCEEARHRKKGFIYYILMVFCYF